jgi:hypothetical protein
VKCTVETINIKILYEKKVSCILSCGYVKVTNHWCYTSHKVTDYFSENSPQKDITKSFNETIY